MTAIDEFLKMRSFGVAGASNDRNKVGNQVLRALVDSNRHPIPIHPSSPEIEGLPAYASVRAVPTSVEALSIITPPAATRVIVDDAIASGVRAIWMQPGAEDLVASERARSHGISVIDDGSCILVALSRERHRK